MTATPSIDEVIASIPDWVGRIVTAERVPAGLTNTNWRVVVDGVPYFVRIPGTDTDLLAVDRGNEIFNTVLAPLSQNGIDMPPTKAEVDTWESGCKEFTATVNAWKTMLGVDLVGFNSLLTKNNLTPLKIAPTALAVPALCTFAWPTATASGGK